MASPETIAQLEPYILLFNDFLFLLTTFWMLIYPLIWPLGNSPFAYASVFNSIWFSRCVIERYDLNSRFPSFATACRIVVYLYTPVTRYFPLPPNVRKALALMTWIASGSLSLRWREDSDWLKAKMDSWFRGE